MEYYTTKKDWCSRKEHKGYTAFVSLLYLDILDTQKHCPNLITIIGKQRAETSFHILKGCCMSAEQHRFVLECCRFNEAMEWKWALISCLMQVNFNFYASVMWHSNWKMPIWRPFWLLYILNRAYKIGLEHTVFRIVSHYQTGCVKRSQSGSQCIPSMFHILTFHWSTLFCFKTGILELILSHTNSGFHFIQTI